MSAEIIPHIQKLVTDSIVKSFNKDGPKVVAKGLYTLLPGVVRLMIKEDSFVNFCIEHQETIFGKTTAKKSAKKATAKRPTTKKRKQ
jgi:hypothetical protein